MSKKFKRVALIPALVLSLGVIALSSCGDKPTVPPTTVPTVPTVVNPIPADLVIAISNKTDFATVRKGDADVAVKVTLKSATDQAAATKLKDLVVIESSNTAALTMIGKYAHFVAPGAATITVKLPGSTATDSLSVNVLAPDYGVLKTTLEISKCTKAGFTERVYVEGKIVEVFKGGQASGYLVADAAGMCYVFGALPDGFKKGDVVVVSGAVEQYHGIGEFKSNKDTPLNVFNSDATIVLPGSETTPVAWDMTAYEKYSKQYDGKFEPIKVTCDQFKAVQKGTFLSYTVGDSELIGRFAYKWDPAAGGFVDGSTYTVTGYAYGRATGEGADFYPTEVTKNPIVPLTQFDVTGPTTLGVGSSSNIKITATINADTTYTAKPKNSKTDGKIVKIDGKKIIGLTEGTATIVVTPTANETLKKEFVINVKNPEIVTDATAATITGDKSATKLYRVKAKVTTIDADKKEPSKDNAYGNGTLTFADTTTLDLGGLTATNMFNFVEGKLSMSNDKSFASTGVRLNDEITMVGQMGNFGFQGYLEEIHDATLYTTTVGALAENVTSVTTSAATAGDLWKTKVTITVAVAAGKNAKVAVNIGEKAIEVTKEVKNTTYSFLMPRGNVIVSVAAVDPIVVGDSLVINPNDLLGEGEFGYADCAARPTVDFGDETYQMTDVMKSTWSTTAPEYGALQLRSKVGKIQNITALPKKVVSIVIDLKKNEPNSKNSNAITVEFADNVNFDDVPEVANDYQSITTIIATTPEVLSYTFTADIFDTNQFDYMRITAADGALYIGKITINFEKAAA